MNKIKKLAQEIGVLSLSITIVFVLVMGISIAKGWTEPAVSAPNGNVAAPINVGSIGQTKDGNMIVNNLGSYVTGLTVNRNLEVLGTIHATGDVCTDVEGGKCLSKSPVAETTIAGHCANRNGNAAVQECGRASYGNIVGNPISPARCNLSKQCECELGYTKVFTGGCGWGNCAGTNNEVYSYSCVKN